MGKFDDCLLASDVDETLLHNGVVPKENLQKIEEFTMEGGIFSISSGRCRQALEMVFDYLDKSMVGPSVTMNGALIYDFSNDEVLDFTTIDERGKKLTQYVAENMRGVGIEVHTVDRCYVITKNNETDAHEEYEKFEAFHKGIDELENIGWLKVLYLPDNDEDRTKLDKLAREEYGEFCDFFDSAANINGEFKRYIEQMPKGVSKGEALKKLKQRLKIKKGGLFGIGDYYNDVAMLKASDVSAVTAGAPDELKTMAKYITCSCAEGAVADFIDYLKKL